jgi:glycosyltransferase involved in cell wall biosynthesis
MPRPTVLMLSPVVPARSGSGRGMRAFQTLRALAETHDVSLLVADHAPPPAFWSNDVTALTAHRYHVSHDLRVRVRLALRRFAAAIGSHRVSPVEMRRPGNATNTLHRFCLSQNFDAVHVFRLYMAPLAAPFLRPAGVGPREYSRRRAHVQLDLDDIESMARQRLSALYRLNGKMRMAATAERDAEHYRRFEREILARFDRIFVCSRSDKDVLTSLYGSLPVDVLPNVIDPSACVDRHNHRGVFRFLFVGAFGHYPNRDAIQFFCGDILSRIRSLTDRPCEVQVVGGGLPGEVRRWLARVPGVVVLGAVDDVSPCYRGADAVVAPLRAGGGTRIKILEGLAHGRPVIATGIGAEGIEAIDGREILIGDTADQIAAHAVVLMHDPDLGRRLGQNGFMFVRSRYGPEHVRSAVRPL